MPKRPIGVLLVDDHEPFRRFLESALGHKPNLQIVGRAVDGLEALQIAEELKPDLILLDMALPKMNGIQIARRILERFPESRILFLSEYRSWDIVEAALSTGAVGYVVKSDCGRELLVAVDAVLEGKQFVSSSVDRPN
jgi:DNA-binding NarL/FixJ family response regulator